MLQTQFTQIVELIQTSRNSAFQAVNIELINLYWKVGNYISIQLEKANWGGKTIGKLALYIKKHHPEIRGFNRPGLYRMKQFYETYANTVIVSPVVRQLELTEKTNNILTKISWTQG